MTQRLRKRENIRENLFPKPGRNELDIFRRVKIRTVLVARAETLLTVTNTSIVQMALKQNLTDTVCIVFEVRLSVLCTMPNLY